MRNLLSNAIKFSLEGGTITVFAEEQTTGVKLTIKDEGVGMEKAKLQ